jgi:hypothetical protein
MKKRLLIVAAIIGIVAYILSTPMPAHAATGGALPQYGPLETPFLFENDFENRQTIRNVATVVDPFNLYGNKSEQEAYKDLEGDLVTSYMAYLCRLPDRASVQSQLWNIAIRGERTFHNDLFNNGEAGKMRNLPTYEFVSRAFECVLDLDSGYGASYAFEQTIYWKTIAIDMGLLSRDNFMHWLVNWIQDGELNRGLVGYYVHYLAIGWSLGDTYSVAEPWPVYEPCAPSGAKGPSDFCI